VRVAFVHDWLPVYAGAERVLEAALELYPGAPIYTLIHHPAQFAGTGIADHPVHTSFLQRLPQGRQRYRTYLPLMPLAIESFDLNAYDTVISSSYAVAKGALTRADQFHVSYVHSPARYAWDLHAQYLAESGLTRGLKGAAARAVLHYLRLWDVASSHRVDVFIANSRYGGRRIWHTYRRRSHVVYPPVDVQRFRPGSTREDFYLTLSRLVPYKKVDLIVRAFNRLRLPLVVIGDGPDRARLARLAGPTVHLLGYQPDPVVTGYLERCKAFVFAADEDFGIVAVEAQAAGAPVIAFGRGGATETVIPGQTGIFFPEQTVASLVEAVSSFAARAHQFDAARIRANAERFAKDRFQREFAEVVERERAHWARSEPWRRRLPGDGSSG
jgi:glycosyltransferase involved in cell wall biosynthesis